MPTALYIVPTAPPHGERLPGMMWRWTPGDLPDEPCWWIMLPLHPDIGTPGHPGELSWRTTQVAADGGRWTVTGTAPLITVTPSIDVVRYVHPTPDTTVRNGSYWHGFITNGIMSP